MLNELFMKGNLTKDPELKYLPSGTAVCTFSLALNYKSKDESGETKDGVDFIPVKVMGKQAEAADKYLKKGSKVLVKGHIKQDSWEKDGKKHSRVYALATFIDFLDPKNAEPRAANHEEAPH